jgi:hypothetical protein
MGKCPGACVNHPLTHRPRHLSEFDQLGLEVIEPAEDVPFKLVHLAL